jgi:hypothetical protein
MDEEENGEYWCQWFDWFDDFTLQGADFPAATIIKVG